jgi:hypothetical protein
MSAWRRARSLVMIGALAVALPACGGGGSGPARPSPAGETASSQAAGAAGPGGTASARAAALLLQPGTGRPRFPAPTAVDNPMFPLRPGTRFSYRGTVVEGGSATPHTVVFTVTDLTKVVGGVRTVVALDQDFLRGRLQEQELAFFAQDASGNVWNFGEYPEEYDHGRLTGAPDTWLTGTGGAHGGIHMLGQPAAGVRYTEGRVRAIEFYDVSQVVSAHRVTCLGSRCLRRVLMVDEWSPGDPASGHQIKYYAPGIGLVRVGARGGDAREYLRLVTVGQLSRPALARARAAALTMDRRAYRVSKIYRVTRSAAAPAS